MRPGTDRNPPTRADSTGSPSRGVILVLAATVGFGLNPVLARLAIDAGVNADLVTLARYSIPAVILAPTLGWWRHAPVRLAVATLGAGAFSGIGTIGYFRALDTVPVPTVLAIYYSFPAFVVILGRVVFHDRASRVDIIAIVLVALGAGIAIGPAWATSTDVSAIGFALLAPVSWALLLLVISKVLPGVPLAPQVGLVTLGATIAIAPFVTYVANHAVPRLDAAALLLALGTVGVLVPALMVTAGGPLIGATTTAVIGSLELVVALTTSWALLGEPIHAEQLLGAFALMAAGTLVAVPAVGTTRV